MNVIMYRSGVDSNIKYFEIEFTEAEWKHTGSKDEAISDGIIAETKEKVESVLGPGYGWKNLFISHPKHKAIFEAWRRD